MLEGLSIAMADQCAVTFKIKGVETQIPIQNEESLLELALKHNLPLNHSCGGFGTCGTCRVYVEKNVEKLPPRNEIEAEMALDRGFVETERLACQNPPLDQLKLRIP